MIAVTLTDRDQAFAWWSRLLEAGVYVNMVVPPASPSGDSLLRCSISAAHSRAQIEQMLAAFAALRTDAAG